MQALIDSAIPQGSASIGVFDSGVGGISVLKHIRAELPNQQLIYCADSLYTPYGNKSQDAIRLRASLLTEFLHQQTAKAIVVACNTATAAAVAQLRANTDMPIIGMEPAVKPAVAATRSGVIGIMATVGTLKSAQFAALLENYGQGVQVVTQACHGLVECVERGELNTPATAALVARYLEPLLAQGADTIVLGCTHYPFVRALIEQIAGPEIAIIDTGLAVARQLKRRLADLDLHIDTNPSITFWTSGNPEQANQVITSLWGSPVSVKPLPDWAK